MPVTVTCVCPYYLLFLFSVINDIRGRFPKSKHLSGRHSHHKQHTSVQRARWRCHGAARDPPGRTGTHTAAPERQRLPRTAARSCPVRDAQTGHAARSSACTRTAVAAARPGHVTLPRGSLSGRRESSSGGAKPLLTSGLLSGSMRVTARELPTNTEAYESHESRTQPCGEVGGLRDWAGSALTCRT